MFVAFKPLTYLNVQAYTTAVDRYLVIINFILQ